MHVLSLCVCLLCLCYVVASLSLSFSRGVGEASRFGRVAEKGAASKATYDWLDQKLSPASSRYKSKPGIRYPDMKAGPDVNAALLRRVVAQVKLVKESLVGGGLGPAQTRDALLTVDPGKLYRENRGEIDERKVSDAASRDKIMKNSIIYRWFACWCRAWRT